MARIDATDFVCTLFVENQDYLRHFCAIMLKLKTELLSIRFLIFSAKECKFRLEKGHSIVGL
jgi:hypothetical protein